MKKNAMEQDDLKRAPDAQDDPVEAERGDGASDPMDESEYDPVDHMAQLEQERDEALARYQRALADFQNFQRRSEQNERQACAQSTAGVVQGLLPVIDHFKLALDQDLEQTTLEQFVQGMRIVRDELYKALQLHGLKEIEVRVGDPFDPTHHEAVAQVPGEGVEPGHVSNITQPGYLLRERVLRAAKVTVAPSAPADDDQG